MNYKAQLALIGGATTSLGMLYSASKSAIYKVEPGQKAFKFNKFSGVQ